MPRFQATLATAPDNKAPAIEASQDDLNQRAADGFLARLELRRDFSDRSVFPAHGGTLSASQTTLTVGLVWWIGTKKGAW